MKEVFRFELSKQVKKPFVYIMWVFLFAQALYYVLNAGEFILTDGAPYNSPIMLFTLLAGIGYVSYVVYAILGTQVLNNDLEYKTASYIYTSSVSESSFFWGRFLGILTTVAIIMLGHLLGVFLFEYTGIVPEDRLMDTPAIVILEGICFMFIPNMFFMFVLSFALATITKKSIGAYLSVIVMMMLMIVAETNMHNLPWITMIDIAGFAELHRQLGLMDNLAKINYRFTFNDFLFWNRILWFAISCLILLYCRKRFSFKKFINVASLKKKVLSENITMLPVVNETEVSHKVRLHFGFKDLFVMSKVHLKNELKSTRFKMFICFDGALCSVYPYLSAGILFCFTHIAHNSLYT